MVNGQAFRQVMLDLPNARLKHIYQNCILTHFAKAHNARFIELPRKTHMKLQETGDPPKACGLIPAGYPGESRSSQAAGLLASNTRIVKHPQHCL